jgi:hypothetical protein
LKVKKRMWNQNYDFKIVFSLQNWKEETITLKNNLEKEILKKIKNYVPKLVWNSLLQKYYNKKVLWFSSSIWRSEYIKKEFLKINLPKWIKDELIKIIPWLAAQESKYDNSTYNKESWAFWIFQFTDKNFIDSIKDWRLLKCEYLTKTEKNQIEEISNLSEKEIKNNSIYIKLKNSFKSSMKKITWSSVNYFDFLHTKLTKVTQKIDWKFITSDRKIFNKITSICWLNKKESEKFMVYMMINSYNTGWERINVLLGNF